MIAASTSAPPAAPPAIAPMDGPSFFGTAVAALSFVVVAEDADPDAVPDAVVDRMLVTLVPEDLMLLLELDPLSAPYAILILSVPKKADVRLFAQLPAIHGFVLQHPINTGVVAVHV
jgi:hypothetical protein